MNQFKVNYFLKIIIFQNEFFYLVYYENNSERSHIAQLSSSNGEIIK